MSGSSITAAIFILAIAVFYIMLGSWTKYINAAKIATVKTVDSRGYLVMAISAGFGVLVDAATGGWEWEEPMKELGLFLTYTLLGIGVTVTAVFLRNLLRSPKLLSVLRANPDLFPVKYLRSNFDNIGLSAPYVSFHFSVTNLTQLEFKFVDNESGMLVFVDVPWHDPWHLMLKDDAFAIPVRTSTEFEVRQRVPPDLMVTFAGYAGRDDMPLSFADLKIPVESQQVGPMIAKFNLKMPEGWHDISVPDRSIGFGPRGGRFPFAEGHKSFSWQLGSDTEGDELTRSLEELLEK